MSSLKTVQEVVRERLAEGSEAALEKFRDTVRPIYGALKSGDPVHIGSSILLELNEGRFLLTAAHVLDWADDLSLYIGPAREPKPVPLSLEAVVTVSPTGARDDDKLDFALAKIDGELGKQLADDRYVLENEISQSAAPAEGRTFTCLGYPNSKNKVTPHQGPVIIPKLGIYTSLGRQELQLPRVAGSGMHILVDHDQKWSRDEEGSRVNSTALRGFSGGAIIDLGRMSDPASLSETLEPKLAALFIEGHATERVIVGTRVNEIMAVIRAKGMIA